MVRRGRGTWKHLAARFRRLSPLLGSAFGGISRVEKLPHRPRVELGKGLTERIPSWKNPHESCFIPWNSMNKAQIRETKSLKEDPPKIEIDLKLRKVPPFFWPRYREQKRILGPIWYPPIKNGIKSQVFEKRCEAWTASASEKAWLFSSKSSGCWKNLFTT